MNNNIMHMVDTQNCVGSGDNALIDWTFRPNYCWPPTPVQTQAYEARALLEAALVKGMPDDAREELIRKALKKLQELR